MLIEGIIVSGILVFALLVLYVMKRVMTPEDVQEAPVQLPEAMAAVAPERGPMEPVVRRPSTDVKFKEARKAGSSRAYEAPYGQEHVSVQHVDPYVSPLGGIVTAAAAIIVADTIYDSVVDTSYTSEYSSPTPSYSESSGSSWGGDSSSSSSSSDSSSSSSWSD